MTHKHLNKISTRIFTILLKLLILIIKISSYYNFELIKRIIWTAYYAVPT